MTEWDDDGNLQAAATASVGDLLVFNKAVGSKNTCASTTKPCETDMSQIKLRDGIFFPFLRPLLCKCDTSKQCECIYIYI